MHLLGVVFPECIMNKKKEQPAATTDVDRLRRLVGKLLAELSERIPDQADSSLPEWKREAQSLGVIAPQPHEPLPLG